MYYFPLKEKLLVYIVHKVGFSKELLVSLYVGQLEYLSCVIKGTQIGACKLICF